MDFLHTVERFYEAAVNPELWPVALEALSRSAGSRGALLTTSTFVPGGLVHTPSLQEAVGQFFDEGWFENDARNAAVTPRHFRDGFFSDHVLFAEEDMRKSEYYEKFARKADVPWFAAGRLFGELGKDAVAISIQRGRQEGPFELAELASLNGLLPRLAPAMTLANTIASIKGKAVVDGLMLARQPALLLKPNGDVWHANAAAEGLLKRHFTLRHSRLSVANTDENRELQTLIERACAARHEFTRSTEILSPVVLRGRNSATPVVVTAAPVTRSASDIAVFSGVILMINDLSASLEFRVETLRKVFDLTKREGEVMSLLGSGHAIPDIATSLGISVETVRSHIKSLFSKTHTNRLAELALLGLRVQGV